MIRKSLIAMIVILMCVTGGLLYGIAISAEQGEATTYTTYKVSQNELLLDGKGKGYVMADEMRFEVTVITTIKSGVGKDITLEELQVPCKAIIRYYKKPDQINNYVAVSIQEVLLP